jgi:Holliday junction resolvasome RuvABC endonuclease subunit
MATNREFGSRDSLGNYVAVGIDQSLTGFAFAVVDTDDPKKYYVNVFKSSYSGVQRLSDIDNFLFEQMTELSGKEITDVAMEGTVLASNAALVLGELSATVKLFFYEYFDGTNQVYPSPAPHLRTPLQIPPMTLKKYASGKGTSKKQEMLLQIYKRYGVEFNDDNAADAYALARLAGGLVIGEIEQKVVEQVQDPKYRDSLV